jgi:hypothetical protein
VCLGFASAGLAYTAGLLASRDASELDGVCESTAWLQPMPVTDNVFDVVYLLGGVAISPIIFMVACPWALSAALLTCEFFELLLGTPTR